MSDTISGINGPMDTVMGVSITPIWSITVSVADGWGVAVAISVGWITVSITVGWITVPITVGWITVSITVIWRGKRCPDERTCGKAETDAAPSPTTVPTAPRGISWNREGRHCRDQARSQSCGA